MSNIRITSCWVLLVCSASSLLFNYKYGGGLITALWINLITFILAVIAVSSEVYRSYFKIEQERKVEKSDIIMLASALLVGFGIMGGTFCFNRPDGYSVVINEGGKLMEACNSHHMNGGWMCAVILLSNIAWLISMVVFLMCSWHYKRRT